MIAALDGGDVALIVLSAFWGLLVLFLCVVLLNTFRVLERTNRELDRVDGMLISAGEIVQRLSRLSGLVERAATGPLVRIISVGAGVRRAASRFGGKKPKP